MDIVWISFIIIIVMFLSTVEAIRQNILDARASILWLFVLSIIAFLCLNRSLIEWLALKLDVSYAPSILFLFGLLFVLIMLFDLTRRMSKLSFQLIRLTQEHALLKTKLSSKEEDN